MDNSETIAAMFKALGDPTRLKIFEYLRSCSCPVTIDEAGDVRTVSGPTVGDICCHINGSDRATSTMSFHLKELRIARLITMQKNGKHIIYTASPEAVDLLITYLEAGRVAEPEPCAVG